MTSLINQSTYELIKSQDPNIVRCYIDGKIQITQLEEELVKYYIMTKYTPVSMEFTRHPFIDVLLAYKLIDIHSFANKYMSALEASSYENCNADVIYHITIYMTDYNGSLFTLDMMNHYCQLFNWKMVSLAIIYKTRVFKDFIYKPVEYKLCIIELMKTIIELDEQMSDMSNTVMKQLNKELDALLHL